jgi:hypothetical protein
LTASTALHILGDVAVFLHKKEEYGTLIVKVVKIQNELFDMKMKIDI